MLNGYISQNVYKNQDQEIQNELYKYGEDDVLEILEKKHQHLTENQYTYTEQKGITGKPDIIAGAESVKRYNFPVILHFSFCNPDKIIKGLEEKAKNKETFDYFDGENFLGRFVIENISTNKLSTYQGRTLSAELSVSLLEAPEDEEKEYSQQDKQNKKPQGNIKEVKPKIVQPPVKTDVMPNTGIFEKLTDSALNKALRQGESYLNMKTNGITGDIINAIR